MIVPVHALGEKALVAVMVPGDGAQDGQAVAKELLVSGIAVRLEIGQGRLGVFPEVGRVP